MYNSSHISGSEQAKKKTGDDTHPTKRPLCGGWVRPPTQQTHPWVGGGSDHPPSQVTPGWGVGRTTHPENRRFWRVWKFCRS